MSFSDIDLPSNRKFGFFFTFVFAVAAAYCFYAVKITWVFIFFSVTLILLFITLIKADALLPLNKLWMRFGQLLGILVSPILLGVIFFGLFTPIAVMMRLSGRDELRLKFSRKASHWIKNTKSITPESFKQQF